jgi:large subunit ribosomal protein L21
MYAVIESGNKQYRVVPGQVIDVELVDNKQSITFNQVLLFADGEEIEIGTPYLKNVKVAGKVVGEFKDEKVTTFKYKNKINYHRTIGHRQRYTRVKIEEIKHGA